MQEYINKLKILKGDGNYRALPDEAASQLLDLCSNDYLGINENTKLQADFWNETTSRQLLSSCSSRLLGKQLKQHTLFETELADAYKKESALLFNSGYHANTGILPALTSKKDLIIADKLVHASIIDGAMLSKADFIRYRHLDNKHLEKLLEKNRKNYNQVFIVSESIFSMDGDIAHLPQLVELKNKFDCLLYIDEAHALGVRGEKGLGCAEEQNCIKDLDFIVGPMGKAFASTGAFVVCKQVFRDYLINFARSFIFSTALPPINVAWSRFVFQHLTAMQAERQKLMQLSTEFQEQLGIPGQSHIIPFIIGTNANAIRKSQILRRNGFNVLPVRYPTVPRNTARLRFSLNAKMNIQQLSPIKKLITES